MVNHSTQLNLFSIRAHQFKSTKSSTATYKFNHFIKRHNQDRATAYMVEPADVKYNNRGDILLTYVPVKSGK